MVETKNHDSEITSMVLQGMARIGVWDAKSMAPTRLVEESFLWGSSGICMKSHFLNFHAHTEGG